MSAKNCRFIIQIILLNPTVKFGHFKFRKAAVNYIIRQSCILDFLTFP